MRNFGACKIVGFTNLGILKLSLESLEQKNFNVIFMVKFKVYYKEESDGLFPN
jgi:hypothetical protein